jgi:hypothetical protein
VNPVNGVIYKLDHAWAVKRPNESTKEALRQGVGDEKELFSPHRRAARAAGVSERDVTSGGCFTIVVRRVSVWLVLTAGVAGTSPALTRALSGHRRKTVQTLAQGRSPADEDRDVEPHPDAHVGCLGHRLSVSTVSKER